MSHEIILFDLPSKGRCTCWSLNPWKARLALNFKNLPYQTEWLEYPSIRPTFESYHIPANTAETNPNAAYSIPAVRLPDGRHVMDSLAIARALEELQAEPALHLDTAWPARAQAAVAKIQAALAPVWMPRVPANLLNPPSRAYFEETRAKRFGMPLAELARSEKAGEKAWEAARPGFEDVKALLGECDDGPYVMGGTPSFADFILAGLWQFFLRLDEGGDLFDRTLRFDTSFRVHYAAVRQWLERDDH